ncbi:hypothetical protein SEUCBS139899_009694 [Sporothrix eucalyptigena]|uniref:Amidohydrolase-related domain-containing protein n=1 Tax=Sporothrix eucalyptigena TaxID=1812306 RepID=A0ABP0CDQ6_9PEZI
MALSTQGPKRSSIRQFQQSLLILLRQCLASIRKYASFLKRPATQATAKATAASTAAPSTVRARAGIRARMPNGSWDSHVHVFDPVRYPLPPGSLYTPPPSSTDDLVAFEATLGLSRVVLVQPSCYGNDNTCMLEALQKLGPRRARAVITFDPATTTATQLSAFHALGVRGVRINLQSVGKTLDAGSLRATLQQYADAVRPLGWVVQVYVSLPLVKLLEDIVPDLDVRVCIDHIGHPDLAPTAAASAAYRASRDPYDLEGFASLIALLKAGSTYTKISGAYRFSQRPADYEDGRPMVQEILRVAGKHRAVFASDWPHTRFDNLDITTWTEKVMDWCEDEATLNAVFRDTAVDLWDVEGDDE